MLSKRWLCAATAVLFALSGMALAQGQGHGNGHGNGNGHGKHDRDDDRDRQYYSEHDRDYMRGWYHDHERSGHLPPGLAKREQLPPGLERQLRVRGTLPPGLRKNEDNRNGKDTPQGWSQGKKVGWGNKSSRNGNQGQTGND